MVSIVVIALPSPDLALKHASPEEASKVIVECQAHQSNEQGNTELLADQLALLRQRASLDEFHEVEEQVPTVEDRDRKLVEDPEADTDDGEKLEKPSQANLRRIARILRNTDGTTEILQRDLQLQHLPENTER